MRKSGRRRTTPLRPHFLAIPSFWRGTRSGTAATPPARRTRVQAQQFVFPLAGPVRVALLEEGFRNNGSMRTFAGNDVSWLPAYAPEALVAGLDLAISLSDRKRRGIFELPSLRTAFVVLTSIEDSPLTDDCRDLLWRAWGVPVFEQLRQRDGTIIARECEVHDGLHIAAAGATERLRSRAGIEIVTSVCECGAETPRMRRAALSRDPGAVRSATA
jgi:hypothetical protein